MKDEYAAPTVTMLGRINSRGPTPGGPVLVADVETETGWSLRITRTRRTFGAVLAQRGARSSMTIAFWPSLDRIFETVTTSLNAVKQPDVARVLRLLVAAEMRR